MIEERFRENKTSARGMYMRSIADITPEWKDIRIADIIPDRSNICSIADIPELSEIVEEGLSLANENIENCEYGGGMYEI